jgi:hypothetical protein
VRCVVSSCHSDQYSAVTYGSFVGGSCFAAVHVRGNAVSGDCYFARLTGTPGILQILPFQSIKVSVALGRWIGVRGLARHV